MAEPNRRVLVFESRMNIALELRTALSRAGYRPSLALDREEALELLSSLSPRVLIIGEVPAGDDVALRAATEIAGTLAVAAPQDPSRVPALVEEALSPGSRAKPSTRKAPPQEAGLVTRMLDDLAVALADEISEREEQMAFRDPPAPPLPPAEGRSRRVETKPSLPPAPTPPETRAAPLHSDGVTQILGLLKDLSDPLLSPRDLHAVHAPTPPPPSKAPPPSTPASGAPLAESTSSLFDLAVSGAGERGPITRLARPTGAEPPPPARPPAARTGAGKPAPHTPEPPPSKPSALSVEAQDALFDAAILKSGIYTPPEAKRAPEPPAARPAVTTAGAIPKRPPAPSEAPREPRREPEPPREPRPRSAFAAPDLPTLPPTRRAEEPLQTVQPATAREAKPRRAPLGPGEPATLQHARQIAEAARTRQSGVWRQHNGREDRALALRRGELLWLRSNAPEDHLATLLHRAGRLTRSQRDELLASPLREPEALAAELLRRGYARRAEVEAALSSQREEILASLLEGPLDTSPEEPSGDPLPGAPLPRLLLSALRRRLRAAEIRPLLARLVLEPGEAPLGATRDLGLSSDELAILQDAAPGKSAHELRAGRPEELALPLLAGLEALGFLRVASRHTESGAEEELALDRARVESKHEEVTLSDYFAILGVSRRATAYEIQRAYRDLSEAFDPAKFQSAAQAALRPQVEEIREVLEDALAVLSDDATRDAYLAQLVDP